LDFTGEVHLSSSKGHRFVLVATDYLSYPILRPKLNALPLFVPGSSFTHKATNSKIKSITGVYYIESYYKTKRSKQRKDTIPQADDGGLTRLEIFIF
jgi:hypothetical protein